MRENIRLYFLISLGFHLCLIILMLLVKGPRVSEVIPRRVVVEFRQAREQIPSAIPEEQSRLPDLDPREMAESLQMQGPKSLSIPGTAPMTARADRELPVGGQRLEFTRKDKPVLPEGNTPTAAPVLPAEMLSTELTAGELELPVEKPNDPSRQLSGTTASSAIVQPSEESGISEAGALEWKGRERQLLRTAGIAFPDILLEEGLEVDVVAVFSVAANGQVMDVDIERSSGYASVDRAVERALLEYLFEPSDTESEDVGQIQYRFRLERRN
jgi:TonB family protein